MHSDITGHVHWLRNTTPYINAHWGRTFVLVLSGEVLAHPNFATIVHLGTIAFCKRCIPWQEDFGCHACPF